MGKYGKWIGGGLGWAFGGPIGAFLGFAIGTVIDNSTVQISKGNNLATTGNDFDASLIILTAAVMKADGKILKSELDFVKAFFVRNFGIEATQERMLLLRDIIKKDIPVHDICFQIRDYMDYHSKLLLVQYLFGIAAADNEVSQVEIDLIETICKYLGIGESEYTSIKAMFVKDTKNYYKILEVSKTATDDEIKKSYRNLAMHYHPDKVTHLGEEYQTAAKEKFQILNEAYDSIKKERGFN